MGKKILITGATGFVGSHLTDYLTLDSDNILFGTTFSQNGSKNIDNKRNKIELLEVDLRNEDEVYSLVDKVKPDVIYHLAAFTSVTDSFKSPRETVLNNIACQINIFEAMRKSNLLDTKTLVVASAEVYGTVKKEDLPMDEETPLNPTNPYAVSKLTQDFLGRQYFLSYGLKTIRVRPFNHVGPGQAPIFVVSSFARKIAEIEKGAKEPVLTVGNLEAKRDWGHAKDYVEGMWLMLQQDKPEDFVIATGEQHSVREFVRLAADELGIELTWTGSGVEEKAMDQSGFHIRSARIWYVVPAAALNAMSATPS